MNDFSRKPPNRNNNLSGAMFRRPSRPPRPERTQIRRRPTGHFSRPKCSADLSGIRILNSGVGKMVYFTLQLFTSLKPERAVADGSRTAGGKSEHRRTGCRSRASAQDRGRRCKPFVTESAAESIPPRLAGVRVKRGCKRPPGAPVMARAMKTSPMQGQIGKLFRKEREWSAQFRTGSFRVSRIDK